MVEFFLLLFIALIVFIVLRFRRGRKLDVASGRIVLRPGNFYDYREYFLLRHVTIEEISESMCKVADANGFRGAAFSSKLYERGLHVEASLDGWKAEIFDEGAPEGMPEKSVFSLAFTEVTVKNGVPPKGSMNRFLTEMEKIFLRFDPETAVCSEDNRGGNVP